MILILCCSSDQRSLLSGTLRRQSSGVDIGSRYSRVDVLMDAKVPSLYFFVFLIIILFTSCRPTEGSCYPPKLRRNVSASANISNLTSQSTPANPGFLNKGIYL
jgi:hypothetical protein